MSGQVLDFLSLSIVPFVGAGGVEIGDKKKEVLAKIGRPMYLRPGPRKPVYREGLCYKGMSISLEDEKVYMITAEEEYKGSTKEGLKVGVTWTALKEIYPSVTFHENKMVWYVPGIDGMSFRIVRPPRDDEIPVLFPYVDEEYEVVDKGRAFVYSISVHDLRYGA